MKTSLKSLEMKGLRSFVDPTSIVFPENGLLLLMGPSGSGKSTIFLGAAYGLGYCPYPASELQSWNGDQKLEVKLGLSTNEGDVTIVRGPRSFVEGAVNVQGASNINPTIAKLTGLNQELLAALTYRPQKTPGLFLSKTNAEMQEFLSILLGLNKFDRAIEVCQEQIKQFEAKLEAANLVLPSKKREYDDAQALTEPGLHDPADFKCQEASANILCGKLMLALQLATEKINESRVAWTKKQAAFTAEKQQARFNVPVSSSRYPDNYRIVEAEKFVQQVKTRLDRLVDLNTSNRFQISTQIGILNHNLREVALKRKQIQNGEKELHSLEQELVQMKDGSCPKCHQTWIQPSVITEIENTETRVYEIYDAIAKLPSLDVEQANIEKQIAELQTNIADDPKIAQMRELYETAKLKLQEEKDKLASFAAAEKLAEQKALHDAIADIMEREKAASDVHLAEFSALQHARQAVQEEYNDAENAWNEAKLRLNTIEIENKAALKERERIAKLKEVTKANYEAADSVVKNLSQALGEEKDLLEMLKSFLTAIFDEVLDQIAYSANEMMAQVPNISHITIKFKSESTTQKGTIKRAITPVVNIGGGERPLRSALSGGMASAVELAVDLAVRKVISARSGAVPGWLILDECFEGLGVADKEACLELLKQASEDTLILVIDHSSETKELFSQTITVENVNGRSKIAES